MKYGDHNYYLDKYKKVAQEQSKLRFKDKLKVWLSLPLIEMKDTSLYKIIKAAYPELSDEATLDEARMTKLFDKIFRESSQKALELSYKLDGSLADMSIDINFDDVDEATEGVK